MIFDKFCQYLIHTYTYIHTYTHTLLHSFIQQHQEQKQKQKQQQQQKQKQQQQQQQQQPSKKAFGKILYRLNDIMNNKGKPAKNCIDLNMSKLTW